jgi:hypothetical protein
VISPPEHQTHDTSTSESNKVRLAKEGKNSIVAAVFASLKSVEAPQKEAASLNESIAAAGSLESLLCIAEAPKVSRQHALRIVSQLADWTASGHVKLSDFEADTRFLKLCRLLGRGVPHGSQRSEKEAAGLGDLAIVLGVTGDDEAAKLVAGMSLSQMIRVSENLCVKMELGYEVLILIVLCLAGISCTVKYAWFSEDNMFRWVTVVWVMSHK